MAFDFAQQCRNLCGLICNRSKAEAFETDAVETAQVMTLIPVSLASTRNEWSAGPECFRVVDGGVKLDHVCAGHNLIKNCQRWWSFSVTHSFSLPLLSKCDFDFDFTQPFTQRLDTSRPQCLD